jgi:hypothetical protein
MSQLKMKIPKRFMIRKKGMKVDRTGAILFHLEKMLADGEIEKDLKGKIEQLIEEVRKGKVNLYEYRKADSGERYGNALIELIREANRRQEKKK